MKIAIVGAGSIGLYYGAKLALAGQDVHFLLRSGLDEASRQGIHINSEADGRLHLQPVNAHATPASIGQVDLVIIALKNTQNSLLAGLIPPLLDDQTAILTLQNGLGSDAILATHFGRERLLGGLCFVCLTRESPATVRHVGTGTVSIGEVSGPPLPRTHEIVAAFRQTGTETRLVENLDDERWRKLVWNVPFNGLSVAEGGVTVDQLLADPRTHAEVRGLMNEILAIAAAHGHEIPADFADHQITRTLAMGPYQPSTMVDYLAGNELEIDAIWGEPLRRANAASVPTPRLAHLHERLLAIVR